jgi:hypothetical protein
MHGSHMLKSPRSVKSIMKNTTHIVRVLIKTADVPENMMEDVNMTAESITAQISYIIMNRNSSDRTGIMLSFNL